MNPIVKKITWRLVVKVEIATAFCRNTTLIIISHVIKIITVGFMHNTTFPTCQNGFGTIAPIPFCPIGKCRHYGFSSDDIGGFSDDMV